MRTRFCAWLATVSSQQTRDAMDLVKMAVTSRGVPCLIVNSYKYRKFRETQSGELLWRCTNESCSGSVRTNIRLTEVLCVRG